MSQNNELPHHSLLVSFAAPKAVRTVARKFGVSTGAIQLLNAVIYRDELKKSTNSAQLQAPKTAAKTLVRANIAELVSAGLVERQRGRGPWLRLTLNGISAGFLFQRELRGIILPMQRN